MADDPKRAGGFGKAFKRDMGREVEVSKDVGAARGPALFMNDTRREMFALLCLRPCLHLSGVARRMGSSVPTARWHIDKLMDAGFVSGRRYSKKNIYFPSGLLEDGDIPLLALLNDGSAPALLREATRNPGLTQKELREILGVRHQVVMAVADRLAGGGLLNIVVDGRFRRYYPTDLLVDRERAQRTRVRRFKEDLIRRLKDDGVEPEVLRTSPRELQLRITSGSRRRSYTIPTSPFRTVLDPADRRRPAKDERAGVGREGDIHIPSHRSRRSRPVEKVVVGDASEGGGGEDRDEN